MSTDDITGHIDKLLAEGPTEPPPTLHDAHVMQLNIAREERVNAEFKNFLDCPVTGVSDQFKDGWTLFEEIDQCQSEIVELNNLQPNTITERLHAKQELESLHRKLAHLLRTAAGFDPEQTEMSQPTSMIDGVNGQELSKPTNQFVETAEQRQARRYQMCIDAGLTMPTDDYAPLPRGINRVASTLGITRQAFSEDVKKHINRLHSK